MPASARSGIDDCLGSIQVLRGLAAMAVVFNHAGLPVFRSAETIGQSVFALPGPARIPTARFAAPRGPGLRLHA